MNVKDFRRYFRAKKFCGEIIGMTPKWETYKNLIGIKKVGDLEMFWNYERGNEIKLWLDWNKHKNIESFIIIDDEVSDIEPVFPDNFIKTETVKGFQGDELLNEAINILNEEKYNG